MNDGVRRGYSIYVVDDEHDIHRFDMETYEWSIVTTTDYNVRYKLQTHQT